MLRTTSTMISLAEAGVMAAGRSINEPAIGFSREGEGVCAEGTKSDTKGWSDLFRFGLLGHSGRESNSKAGLPLLAFAVQCRFEVATLQGGLAILNSLCSMACHDG